MEGNCYANYFYFLSRLYSVCYGRIRGSRVLTAFGSGVVDGDEEEAGGGGGGAGTGAVASGEQRGNGGGREAVRAGLDEGADQVANHVVEKAVGGDAIDEEVVGGAPLGVGDGADGGARL
jgi:hypothetical protein